MNAETIRSTLVPILYLVSAVLFILGLKRLSRVRTAAGGNRLAAVAMLIAVVGTLLEMGVVDYGWIVIGTLVGGTIGAIAAARIPMTAMPEMVALLNGSGGAASMLVALAIIWRQIVQPGVGGVPATLFATLGGIGGGPTAVTAGLSVFIGGLTFTGSLVAYAKLRGTLRKGQPILIPARHVLNLGLILVALGAMAWFAFGADTPDLAVRAILILSVVALLLGVLLVIPIGGADMPVVVSLLNSYSGMAACATGFVLNNNMLIIAGALVGASGLILTNIMCVAMNRSLLNVLVGGFGEASSTAGAASEYVGVKSAGPEEAAMVLEAAESVVFVPGYGLAVAQAQHAARELGDLLQKRGAKVTYAIHPVAGRMPGHMNVLLAEADVPYEQLVEMDAINPDLKATDVVMVLGANDVVNPAALRDPKSPIAGMPIIRAHEARSVFVVKRSLSPGYAGIKNELFEHDNTMMVFGDAKQVLQELITELKELT